MTKEGEAWQPELQNPEPRNHLVSLVRGHLLPLPTGSPLPHREENEPQIALPALSRRDHHPPGEARILCAHYPTSCLPNASPHVCECVTKSEPGSAAFWVPLGSVQKVSPNETQVMAINRNQRTARGSHSSAHSL